MAPMPVSPPSRPAGDLRRTLAVALLGAAVLAAAYGVHDTVDLVVANRRYVALGGAMLAACGLASVLLWRRARRRDVAIVLVVALVARLVVAFDAPTLSDDAYRFVWDGRVQAAGVNPFSYPPASPALAALRDHAVFPELNRPFVRTLYPPLDQLAFLAINRVAGEGVVAVKLAWLALEAGVVALLLVALRRSGASPGRVALYAWHPLAVVEIASSGHPEPLVLAPMLAALLLWDRGRQAAAGVALACAVLARFVPVVLAPFMLRRGRAHFAAAFAGTAALLYLPYAGAGTAALGSVGHFAHEESGAGPYRWLVAAGLGPTAARGLLLAALAAVVAVSAARPPSDLTGACRHAALLLGATLLASSQVQPWYLLWLLPLLCVAPEPGLLWACASASGLYLSARGAVVVSPDILAIVVWVPTLALLGASLARSRLGRRQQARPALPTARASAAGGG
jgi:alpha-1,6-mannosyltransferase